MFSYLLGNLRLSCTTCYLNGSNLLPLDINLHLFNIVEEYIVN